LEAKTQSFSIKEFLMSTVFKNSVWLFILQFINTIIPYFTFPYIVRVLGAEQYGFFALSSSFIGYIQTVVDYGFNMSAVRDIANMGDGYDKEIHTFYSSVVICKLMLFALSVIVTIPLVAAIPALNECTPFIVVLFIMVLSNSLFPVWYFQGIQKMKYIAVISIIVRIGFLASVFVFVKTRADAIAYTWLNTLTSVLIAAAGLLAVRFILKVKFTMPGWAAVKEQFKAGWYLFTTSVMIRIISVSGSFLLGIFYSKAEVGEYSAVEKISQVVSLVFAPISQACFPYNSQRFAVSTKDGLNSVRKMMKLILPVFVFGCILIIFLRGFTVNLLFGSEYIGVADILIPLMLWIMLSILNNFLGIQTLVAANYNKEYNKAIIIAGIICLAGYVVFGKLMAGFGVALGAMIGEFTLTVLLLIQLRRLNLSYKG